MRYLPVFLSVIIFLTGCQTKQKTKQIEDPVTKLKNEAVEIARNYALAQLENGMVSVDNHGVVAIADSSKKYEIFPSAVVIGLIDEDENKDAIVSLLVKFKNETIYDEHLVLINKNGKLDLVREIESNMKIVMIANRIITAEYHTKPRTSPLYNCEKCTVIKNYKFKGNDLVEVK